MPSFADVIKPEEAWDLVHYLRTLQVTHKSPELALWIEHQGRRRNRRRPENRRHPDGFLVIAPIVITRP